jgi:hypothetical protein
VQDAAPLRETPRSPRRGLGGLFRSRWQGNRPVTADREVRGTQGSQRALPKCRRWARAGTRPGQRCGRSRSLVRLSGGAPMSATVIRPPAQVRAAWRPGNGPGPDAQRVRVGHRRCGHRGVLVTQPQPRTASGSANPKDPSSPAVRKRGGRAGDLSQRIRITPQAPWDRTTQLCRAEDYAGVPSSTAMRNAGHSLVLKELTFGRR